jgi:hypothetical protein
MGVDDIYAREQERNSAGNHKRGRHDHQIDWDEVDRLIKRLREMLARLDTEPSNRVKMSRKSANRNHDKVYTKAMDGDVRRSRSITGETVTISKGELAKLHANYAGDKVFIKKDVDAAIQTIDAAGKIHLANREEDETVSKGGETVIESTENVSESSKSVRRLAKPKNFDSDANKGYNDSEYMNRRGWADGVLSVEDRALLRVKISEAQRQGFEAHPRLSDGSYLFEVNNKIVLVSGDFENPFYDGVVDINADNADTFDEIRKEIEDATNGKRYSSSAFLEIVEGYYGKEVLRVYRREDWVSASSYSRRSYPTRPDGYKDFGYSGEQQYGSGSA